MYKLKSLKIQNFTRFSSAEIDFPESGLLLVKGASGAGKSSIFHAINFALGICALPATSLPSWGGSSLVVELELSGPKSVLIRKTTKSTNIYVDGVLVSTANKDAEQHLTAIFGADWRTRELLTYRDQLSPVRFSRLSDQEKKSILSGLLGLEIIERELEETGKQVQELSRSCQHMESYISGLEEGLPQKTEYVNVQSLVDLQAILLSEQRTWDDEQASLSLSMKQKKEAELAPLLLELKTEKSRTPPKIPQELLAKKRRLEAAQIHIQKEHLKKVLGLESKVLELKKKLAQKPELEKQLAVVLASIQKVNSGICYACGQSVATGDSLHGLKTLEKELLRKIEELPTQGQVDQAALEVINLESFPNEELDSVTHDLHKTNTEILDLEKKISAFVSDQKAKIAQINALIEIRNDLKYLPKEYPKSGELLELGRKIQNAESINRLAEAYDAAKAKVEAKRAELLETKVKLNFGEDYRSFLKGFLANIFEEVLLGISAETNKILERLPNTEGVTVRFAMAKDSGKEAITPIFSFDGNESGIKSASGGMATAIDLAIDLALAKVVSERKGVSFGWILLDEAFNGFDQDTREAMLTTLSDYASVGLVAVVDHASEAQALFSNVIYVKKEGKIETYTRKA